MDIGEKYFSSGKLRQFFKDNKEQVNVKVLKTFKTSLEAIDYEAKIHKRLDVRNHPKFFNEQNQKVGAGDDRTGRVTVFNNETKERMTISSEEFHKDPSKFSAVNKGLVIAVDSLGNRSLVPTEEFKVGNHKGINSGLLHVKMKHDGSKTTIKKKIITLQFTLMSSLIQYQ